MEGAAECDRIHRNRCHKTIEPSAPEQEPITATQEHQDRRGGAECFSSRGGVVQSQRATIGLWCVCEHGVTRGPPPPPFPKHISVSMCAHTHSVCIHTLCLCMCVCRHAHLCKHMHANLSALACVCHIRVASSITADGGLFSGQR